MNAASEWVAAPHSPRGRGAFIGSGLGPPAAMAEIQPVAEDTPESTMGTPKPGNSIAGSTCVTEAI
jgi:hypothetical protein